MTTSILSRVAPEDRQKLLTPLADTHAAALKTMLNAGLLRSVLPDEIAQPLIAAGYVKSTLGGQPSRMKAWRGP